MPNLSPNGEGRKIAFVGANLIDGTGKDPVDDATVLVEHKLVVAAGRKRDVTIPRDCTTVDISGKTIMPGMFDCHTHVGSTTFSIEQRLFTPKTVGVFQTAQIMKRTLYAGFTTIREPGLLNDIGFRQAVEQGLIEGPRMVLAGGIGQTGGHFDHFYPREVALNLNGFEICDGIPDLQKAARQVLRKGFDFIKVCASGGVASPADSPEYTEWTLDELKTVVYEAKARGKAVMAHAEGNQGIKNAIRAGVWSVEHGSMLDDEAIQLFLDTGTYLVPTLFVVEEILARGKAMGLSDVSLAKIQILRHVHAESFRRAAAAGVKFGVGTDSVEDKMHGRNACELELMVREGITPMQAIVAATRTSAEVCRIAGRVGTLEPQKSADLLVVDGNPLDDIRILQDPSRLLVVMKEGASYVNRLN